MVEQYGSGEQWQAARTREWIERLAADPDGAAVYVLEGQTRPSFARPRLDALEVPADMVLLDCTAEVRRKRLVELRNQPELVTVQMETWAAYLRGQADALDLLVIDTSEMTVDAVADELVRAVEDLARGRNGFFDARR